jgi:uncharacterized protein YndB with AHSA1/START domain
MKTALAALALPLLTSAALAQDPSPIVCETLVEAPRDSVWAVWATGAGLRSWLAPHAEIELGLGGRMRVHYSPEGNLDGPGVIENEILAFEPGRMLAIRVARHPETFPFPAAVRAMWTVLTLTEDGPGRTRVRVCGLGFDNSEESRAMRAFFERGNAQTLEQLQRRFAPSAPPQAGP